MSNLSFEGLKNRSFIIFLARNKESVVFAVREGFHRQGGRTESSRNRRAAAESPTAEGLIQALLLSQLCPSLRSPWMLAAGSASEAGLVCFGSAGGLKCREYHLDSSLAGAHQSEERMPSTGQSRW